MANLSTRETDDGVEITWTNRPTSRLSIWFFEPFMTIKQQLQASPLQDSEEAYFRKMILLGANEERMKNWNNGGVEPEDDMKRAELQALARRYILFFGHLVFNIVVNFLFFLNS